ncbi:MAG TPA: cysteine synthase A [bacterium]|nr:cysteine synthase A [bacterium]
MKKQADKFVFIQPNILSHIGNTPIVRLANIVSDNSPAIFAKLEMFNPCGSVKDRIALAMIEDAEKKEILKPGNTVIEPTSGNTGIGLAMVCSVKKYRCILTMPESMSLERISILKFLGAEIVLTPAASGMAGAISEAQKLCKTTPGAFMPMQFENPVNPEVHKRTTAREIIAVLGDNIDGFVAGVGTGGTLTGIGEVLKKRNPSIKIFAVEPENCAVLSGGKVGLHKIMGIGPGFIPKILNRNIIDDVITITDEIAYETTKKLSQKEGIFAGISSGAACAAALKISSKFKNNQKIVVIFPDTGERYLSLMNEFEK